MVTTYVLDEELANFVVVALQSFHLFFELCEVDLESLRQVADLTLFHLY